MSLENESQQKRGISRIELWFSRFQLWFLRFQYFKIPRDTRITQKIEVKVESDKKTK